MGIRGVNETIQKIRAFGDQAKRLVNAETEAIAMQIERDAKRYAPANFGKLKQSISRQKISPSHYRIMVNEMYGAYMEFGTGAKVKVPAEFRDMANSFRPKTGKTFEQGLESIKVWCRAKGIDEDDAFIIFVTILMNGLEPRPFLYPAYVKGKKDYLNNLQRLLRNLNARV
jgi:HK97 gp10 family phage protein